MNRLLIVDDECDITEAMGELLGDRYDVKLAYDGSEALKMLLQEQFDAVILDLMMPTSGETLMAELKVRGIKVPVIFASSASNLAERARRSGAADFIPKPFDFERLEEKLARLLGSKGGGGSSGTGGGNSPIRSPKESGAGAASIISFRSHSVLISELLGSGLPVPVSHLTLPSGAKTYSNEAPRCTTNGRNRRS